MATIKFKNGGSINLPDGDSPNSGRGLRPFEYMGEMNDDGRITMKAQDWLDSNSELHCNLCKRKSIAKKLYEVCDFLQPNGTNCNGIFLD